MNPAVLECVLISMSLASKALDCLSVRFLPVHRGVKMCTNLPHGPSQPSVQWYAPAVGPAAVRACGGGGDSWSVEGVSSLVVQRLLCHTILEPPSSGIAVSWGLFFSSPALKNLVWSNPKVVIGYVD